MAIIEAYQSNRKPAWRVKWRDNGIILPNGKKAAQTVTCRSEAQAKKLKELVDEAGNRMPPAKLLEVYGLDWVLGDQVVRVKAPVIERVTVSDLCWRYLAAKAAAPSRPAIAP